MVSLDLFEEYARDVFQDSIDGAYSDEMKDIIDDTAERMKTLIDGLADDIKESFDNITDEERWHRFGQC